MAPIWGWGFPCGSAGKQSACNAGDLGLIPGLGRSPGEGKGYQIHSSGLKNSTDCIVHGVTKSRTWLSDFHFTLYKDDTQIHKAFHIFMKNAYHFVVYLRLTHFKSSIRQFKKTLAAAAAKSLQSCPTLCDPIDGSPPGSPVPGILQARTLEWVAISFSNAWKWKVKGKSLSRVRP